jgi:hypothetical protein
VRPRRPPPSRDAFDGPRARPRRPLAPKLNHRLTSSSSSSSSSLRARSRAQDSASARRRTRRRTISNGSTTSTGGTTESTASWARRWFPSRATRATLRCVLYTGSHTTASAW